MFHIDRIDSLPTLNLSDYLGSKSSNTNAIDVQSKDGKTIKSNDGTNSKNVAMSVLGISKPSKSITKSKSKSKDSSKQKIEKTLTTIVGGNTSENEIIEDDINSNIAIRTKDSINDSRLEPSIEVKYDENAKKPQDKQTNPPSSNCNCCLIQ